MHWGNLEVSILVSKEKTSRKPRLIVKKVLVLNTKCGNKIKDLFKDDEENSCNVF